MEDLCPLPLVSLVAVTGPQSGNRRVWSPQPEDQSNGNSTFLHCCSMTTVGHMLQSDIKFFKELRAEMENWALTAEPNISSLKLTSKR